MPTKTWVVGEEVLAADFNAMVQKQVVATFANAAARTAAIPAPSEGMVSYLLDTTSLQIYRGAMWRPPKGTKVSQGSIGLNDVNAGAVGVYDLAPPVEQATTFPYPTTTFANVNLQAGFSGSAVSFRADVYAFGPSAVVAGPGLGVWAQVSNVAANSLAAAWGVNAGLSVGYKVRLFFDVGSSCHTYGSMTWQVFAD